MLCDQMLSVKKRERESERETVPLLMDGNGCHIRCNRSSGRNDTFYAFDKWFCHQIRMNWCPWWNNTHARTHTPSAEHYANICEWGEKLPSRFSFIFGLERWVWLFLENVWMRMEERKAEARKWTERPESNEWTKWYPFTCIAVRCSRRN